MLPVPPTAHPDSAITGEELTDSQRPQHSEGPHHSEVPQHLVEVETSADQEESSEPEMVSQELVEHIPVVLLDMVSQVSAVPVSLKEEHEDCPHQEFIMDIMETELQTTEFQRPIELVELI